MRYQHRGAFRYHSFDLMLTIVLFDQNFMILLLDQNFMIVLFDQNFVIVLFDHNFMIVWSDVQLLHCLIRYSRLCFLIRCSWFFCLTPREREVGREREKEESVFTFRFQNKIKHFSMSLGALLSRNLFSFVQINIWFYHTVTRCDGTEWKYCQSISIPFFFYL